MKALDHKTESEKAEVRLVVDTGVNKTLISEESWKKLKPHKGEREPKLKKNKQSLFLFALMGSSSVSVGPR